MRQPPHWRVATTGCAMPAAAQARVVAPAGPRAAPLVRAVARPGWGVSRAGRGSTRGLMGACGCGLALAGGEFPVSARVSSGLTASSACSIANSITSCIWERSTGGGVSSSSAPGATSLGARSPVAAALPPCSAVSVPPRCDGGAAAGVRGGGWGPVAGRAAPDAGRDWSPLITWRIDASISSTVWSCAKSGFAIVMPRGAPRNALNRARVANRARPSLTKLTVNGNGPAAFVHRAISVRPASSTRTTCRGLAGSGRSDRSARPSGRALRR